MVENHMKNLTDRLFLSLKNGSLSVPHIIKSINNPNPENSNVDKTKIESFLAEVNHQL